MNRRDFVNRLAALPLAAGLARAQDRPAMKDDVSLAGGTTNRGLARPDYPISPVPYLSVDITDSFWTPRIEATRRVAVPYFFDRMEHGHYQDMRVIEGACYFLAKRPDPDLRALVESRLEKGIESMHRLEKMNWPSKWDGSTLPAGDFFLSSIAYQQATGSRKLMDVAIQVANSLDSTYGPAKRHDISSHEGVEFALVSLYRATGDRRYYQLAKFFIDQRGNWKKDGRPSYGPYAQDQIPLKEQTRAIGHCVRATYLYNGLTDIVALSGDPGYARANQRIWEDAVTKRTYVTGGIGSYRNEECFGDAYDLPNLGCWNEICAACGNTWWNHRLFLLYGDSKYIDFMERVLYNGLLAGVSLNGGRHLYQTPLKTTGGFERHLWFGPECCPPNITRLLASLGGLIYANDGQNLYVNLFIGSRAHAMVGRLPVDIQQETDYPWKGSTKVTVNPAATSKFPVLVRIPGWAGDEAFPEGLYRYAGKSGGEFTLTVNGSRAPYVMEKGYAKIDREWAKGDVIELELPMPVREVVASEEVADDRGMISLQRGPLVFCAEGVDNLGAVFNLQVPEGTDFRYEHRDDMLGGIGTIAGKVQACSAGESVGSFKKKEQDFLAIPFYAFGNRDPGQMAVWLARSDSRVEVGPVSTLTSTSRATSSCGNGTIVDDYPHHTPPTVAKRWYPNSQDGSGDIRAIYDQIEPVNSEDESSYFLRLRPQSGDQAWVQYDFAKPAKVSSVDVYWKDDKQYVVLPSSWRLLYKQGGDWKPVNAKGPYGVEKDKYNSVEFEPVETSALRMEIRLQGRIYKKGQLGPPDGNWVLADYTWYEGGVIEWNVHEA